MDASKEVLHGIATFTGDISPSFPYVNAELGGWDYDQTNQVLLLKMVITLLSGFALLLAPALASALFPFVLPPAFVGELGFALWLVFKGVDVEQWTRRRTASIPVKSPA